MKTAKITSFASVFIILSGILLGGCASSPRFASRPEGTVPASPEAPEPSSYRSYNYLATTNNCDCENFEILDQTGVVGYEFHATYRMDNGIYTEIGIKIKNNSSDTLSFEHAAAKVASRNVQYEYNDKFLPIPLTMIPPGRSDEFHLSGKDRSGENDWHKIAGEQVTLTIQGLRLGGRDLNTQVVTFVPKNPMIGK